MNVLSKEYVEHEIFDKLSDFSRYYDGLSYCIGYWMGTGTTAVLNFESHIFSSMKGTLESISLILKDGKINDAYALLRKYYDSVLISAYVPAFVQEHHSIENLIVKEIDGWVFNKMKLPENRIIIPYVRNFPKLSKVNELLAKDDRYKKIRERCNDHMHFNSFYYLMINDNELYDKNRIKFLNLLSKDVEDIFIKNFIYTFTLNDHYMASTDYSDYMDMGMEPPENSQYFVAGFIQDTFDKYISVKRMDLAQELKNNTSMQLELKVDKPK